MMDYLIFGGLKTLAPHACGVHLTRLNPIPSRHAWPAAGVQAELFARLNLSSIEGRAAGR
jgi:hypothetical protein